MVESESMVTWKHVGHSLWHMAGIPLLFSTIMNVSLVPMLLTSTLGTERLEAVGTVEAETGPRMSTSWRANPNAAEDRRLTTKEEMDNS